MTWTIRSESGYGNGRSRIESTIVAMAAVDPIPRASVTVAATVNARSLTKVLRDSLTLLHRSMSPPPATLDTGRFAIDRRPSVNYRAGEGPNSRQTGLVIEHSLKETAMWFQLALFRRRIREASPRLERTTRLVRSQRLTRIDTRSAARRQVRRTRGCQDECEHRGRESRRVGGCDAKQQRGDPFTGG